MTLFGVMRVGLVLEARKPFGLAAVLELTDARDDVRDLLGLLVGAQRGAHCRTAMTG